MHMNRILLFLLVFVGLVHVASAQNQSIGIRLGDPTGVTYKKYLNRSSAVEFGLGTAATGWNHNYYVKSFHNKKGYNGNIYNSHSVSNIIYLQGRYLLNYPVPVQGVEGKFDWYWGGGAVLKLARVQYYYQNEAPPYNTLIDERTDIDFGPEGIVGAEYKFEDLPFTLFAEVSLMLEIADRPGAFRGFIGTGARYNF
jgi:hypothetical protein